MADEWNKPLSERMHFEISKTQRADVWGTWLISFRNPIDILRNEPTFLVCELLFYMLAYLTFRHAWRSGRRYRWLWFTTVAHGLMTECVIYW